MAAEIGIVLVHGIGAQIRGETLVNMGDPLYRTLKNWIESAPLPSDGARGSVDLQLKDPSPISRGKVQLIDAFLSPLKAAEPPQAVEPAYVRLSVPRAHDGRPMEWIMAECNWASSFPPPSPRTVTLWIMRVLPWICLSFLARRVRIAAIAIGAAMVTSPRGWLEAAFRCASMMINAIALLLISPLVVVMEFCLIALLIVELVPLKVVQDFVQRINTAISAILGDSFIFASSEIRQEAVVSKLAADLAWLESKFGCKKIVLVAHSQGAAISYLTLKKCGLGRVSLLITFGAGIHKLCQLTEPKEKWSILFLGYFLLFCGCFSLVVLAAWFGIFKIHGSIWPNTALALFLVVSLTILGLVGERTGEIELQASEFARGGLKWIDLYASKDPVPNGPLFLSNTTYPESIEVCNQQSPIADHTSYAKNTDEFLPLIVNTIAQHSGAVQLNESVQVCLKRLRRIRIGSSRIDQRMLIAALFAFLLDRAAMNSVGMWLGGWINAACSQAGVESCWKYSATTTGFAVALVAYVFCRMCVQAIESAWSNLYSLDFRWWNWHREHSNAVLGLSYLSHGLAALTLSHVSVLYYPHTLPWIEALHRYFQEPISPERFQATLLGALLAVTLCLLDVARTDKATSLVRAG
jgi:hypothetical protein